MRIKKLREIHGIQQKELASVIGISPNTLSQYENGKREPGLEVISKLSDYFNVTSDFIYGLSEVTKCNKCGLEFCPLVKSDVDIHAELHSRWEKAIKKYGQIYSLYSENEKIKAKNRNIVDNLDSYSLEERYHAQLEVFRCLFSRSLSATNYNENHIDFATYVSMLLNQAHFKKTLDTTLYNKLVDEYGTTDGIPYGTYYEPTIQVENTSTELSTEEIDIIRMYSELDPHGKEMVDFTLEKEWERSIREKGTAPKADTPTRILSYYYRLASAGTGQILFDMPPTKRIEIPDIPEYRKADYAIGINGDSMEPVYHDGDMLLVEMTEEIKIGEIGIFSLDGDCYVKKLGEGELISLNPKYSNIPLNETAKCMGRVIDKLT